VMGVADVDVANPLCVKWFGRGVIGRVDVARRAVLGGRVSVAGGFGSDCSEEPGHVRCDAGHAGFQ
jgi:hypothetical protein